MAPAKASRHSCSSHSSTVSASRPTCASSSSRSRPLQTTSAATRAPSATTRARIDSAAYSCTPSSRHSSTTSAASSPTTPMPAISWSTTCSSRRSVASSRSASSATPRLSSSMRALSLRKRVSSRGSRRLKPKVTSGRLAQRAVSQTAWRAMGRNSPSMTRRMTALQRCSSRSLSSPTGWSWCPSATVSTTSPLTSRQITLAASSSVTDWATRQLSSSRGYTCRRTRNPRTSACIFRRRPRPRRLMIWRGSKPEAEGGGGYSLMREGLLRRRCRQRLLGAGGAGGAGGLGVGECGVRVRCPAIASSERLLLLSLSIQQMSGYGWLTESSLLPKKSKPIPIDDQASLFGLRAVLLREKERIAAGSDRAGSERRPNLTRKPVQETRNAGVDERAKKDERQGVSKLVDGVRVLQAKERVYESLESAGQNVGKLLVDFSAKALEGEDGELERLREEFYAGRLQEIQAQRAELGEADGAGERDARERLAWERELLGRMRGEGEEREKVQQVFDRRLLEEEKQALESVRREISEEASRIEEVRQRREELHQQRIRKLKKLNILQHRPEQPDNDKRQQDTKEGEVSKCAEGQSTQIQPKPTTN